MLIGGFDSLANPPFKFSSCETAKHYYTTTNIGSVMSKQEHADDNTNIRNSIFNKTGLKVAVDDPVVQLIKAQQDFIESSYSLAIKDLELTSVKVIASIDAHNEIALERLSEQINGLNGIYFKMESLTTELLESNSKPKASPVYFLIGILCGLVIAGLVIILT